MLLIQPTTRPPGGGQAVAAWVLEALARDHDLTLLTLERPDFVEIDRQVGTTLAGAPIAVELAWRPVVALLELLPLPLNLLRMHLLLHRARRLAAEFDVVLSTQNEVALGRRCIQYVHFPWAYQPRPPVELRWFHRLPGVLPLYYAIASRLSSFDAEGMRANLTLVNSDWTGERFRSWHGGTTRTVPPPAIASGPGLPWESRGDTLVCLGRIAPEKELDKVLAIAEAVRARRPAVRLHFVGGGRGETLRHIRREVAARASWATLDENLGRDALAVLLGGARYGLHGMRDEHFGMAVAELVRAGCIVFAPGSGGQAEILDDARLLYDSPEDATEKIVRVMEDDAAQRALRAHLERRGALFTPERFIETLRAIVRAWPDETLESKEVAEAAC